MLKEHSEALFGWLKELVDELQRREKEQRVAIVTRGSVSALMHPSWRWLLSKIHEASLGAADKALLAQHSVPCLREVLDGVEKGLAERGIDHPHPWHVKTARAALDRLAELLSRAAAGEAVQLDVAAFTALAESHLTEIDNFLKGIDERLKDPKGSRLESNLSS